MEKECTQCDTVFTLLEEKIMLDTVETEIDTYLAANWAYTPIHRFVNDPGKVSGFNAWISWKFDNIDTKYIGVGSPCKEMSMFLMVSIFTASAEGTTESRDLVSKLMPLLMDVKLPNEIEFWDVIGPIEGDGFDHKSNGKWFETQLGVLITHRFTL